MKREDIPLLVASLVIAIALWFQVQPLYEPGREREYIVPLKIEGKPDGLAVFPAADSVTLIASGTLTDLDKLDAGKVTAYLDLSTIKPGESNQVVQVRIPGDSNLEFRPKSRTVKVSCEQILRTQRDIEVVTTGTPPAGYDLASTAAYPKTVELFGPASYVKQVKSLKATVDLSRLKPGQSASVPVALLDEKGDPVPSTYTNPANVTVAASFTASRATREVPVIVDWTGKVAAKVLIQEITVVPDKVEISGKSEDVSAINTVDTVPLVVDGLSGDKTFTLKLIAPPGVTLKTTEVLVNVKVKRR